MAAAAPGGGQARPKTNQNLTAEGLPACALEDNDVDLARQNILLERVGHQIFGVWGKGATARHTARLLIGLQDKNPTQSCSFCGTKPPPHTHTHTYTHIHPPPRARLSRVGSYAPHHAQRPRIKAELTDHGHAECVKLLRPVERQMERPPLQTRVMTSRQVRTLLVRGRRSQHGAWGCEAHVVMGHVVELNDCRGDCDPHATKYPSPPHPSNPRLMERFIIYRSTKGIFVVSPRTAPVPASGTNLSVWGSL